MLKQCYITQSVHTYFTKKSGFGRPWAVRPFSLSLMSDAKHRFNGWLVGLLVGWLVGWLGVRVPNVLLHSLLDLIMCGCFMALGLFVSFHLPCPWYSYMINPSFLCVDVLDTRISTVVPTFGHPCLKTKRICSVLSAVCPIWPPHVWGLMTKLVYNSFVQVLERMANELEHRVVKACSLSPYTGESIAMTYSYVQDTIWSFVIVLGNISWILLLLLYGLEIHLVLMLSYFSTLFIICTQFRLTRYAAEKRTKQYENKFRVLIYIFNKTIVVKLVVSLILTHTWFAWFSSTFSTPSTRIQKASSFIHFCL